MRLVGHQDPGSDLFLSPWDCKHTSPVPAFSILLGLPVYDVGGGWRSEDSSAVSSRLLLWAVLFYLLSHLAGLWLAHDVGLANQMEVLRVQQMPYRLSQLLSLSLQLLKRFNYTQQFHFTNYCSHVSLRCQCFSFHVVTSSWTRTVLVSIMTTNTSLTPKKDFPLSSATWHLSLSTSKVFKV